MKNYYRVMLGKKRVHAAECFSGGFIGTDFGIKEDLTGKLPEGWREFNQRYIPVLLARHPGEDEDRGRAGVRLSVDGLEGHSDR